VRGVGQELPEPFLGGFAFGKGMFDIGEHGVERKAQLAHFAVPTRWGYSL
jgi:hypothetical protein